jgi:hypothetical protein
VSSALDKLHGKILASGKVVGDPYYLKLSPEELLDFARAEGNAFQRASNKRQFTWSYVPRMSVKEIADNLDDEWTEQKWRDFIDTEQQYREEEARLEGDDAKADYLPDMAEKMKSDIDDVGPLLVARLPNGKYEIGDGYHRFAIAIMKKIKAVPVVLGVPR